MVFPKQAFIRIKNLDRQGKQSLRIGRFEFSDGTETAPANATLAAVKRDRVAQRFLGPFGYTHVGRSFDGIQYTYAGKAAIYIPGSCPYARRISGGWMGHAADRHILRSIHSFLARQKSSG